MSSKYLAICLALVLGMGCQKEVVSAQPVPAKVAVNAGEVASAVAPVEDRTVKLKGAVERSRLLLMQSLSGHTEAVRCEQGRIGDSMVITLRGRQSTWPLGKFSLDDAPHALAVTEALAGVYRSFAPLVSEANDPIGIAVNIELLGSADANPMPKALHWRGSKLYCDTGGRQVELNPDYSRITNNLLGCARSGSVASSLISRGVPVSDIAVRGRELTSKGEEHRYIDATLRVRNLFLLVEEESVCPREP